MAQDRIEEKDIFSGDIFAGTKKSANELAIELGAIATGLEKILERQKKILETTKVDSAAAIKKLNEAIRNQQIAQKGLLQVIKQQEKVTKEQIKQAKESAKVKQEDAKADKERAKALQESNKATLIATKNEQEREKVATERTKRVGVELDNKAKLARAEKAETAAREAAERAAKRQAKQKERLNSLYAQESARLAKVSRRLQDLTLAGRTSSKTFKLLQNEFTTLNARIRKADASVGRFQRNVGNYPKIFRGAISTLKRFGAALGITGGIIALGNAIRNAGATVAEFEQRQTSLAAILGKTREETASLTADAEKFGATTFFTASQVSELQIELAKLGFTLDQISGATAGALSLAAAFGTDLANAAKVTAGTIRGFNLAAEESARVADVIASAYSNSAIDLEKFEVAVSKVAPIAQSLNIDLETTTAVLGQLVNANFDASTAGTQFRNILLKLSDGTSDLAKEVGFTVKSSEDLIDAFDVLNEKGLDVADTQRLIDVRSVALLQNLIDNTEAVKDLAVEFDNAGGVAERIANQQLETLSGKTTLLKSAWDGFIISLDNGNGVLSETIKKLLDYGTAILNASANLPEADPSTTFYNAAGSAQALADAGEELLEEFYELEEGFLTNGSNAAEMQKVLIQLKNTLGDAAVSFNAVTNEFELQEEAALRLIKIQREQEESNTLALAQRLKSIEENIRADKARQSSLEKQVAVNKELAEVSERVIRANNEAGFSDEQIQKFVDANENVKNLTKSQAELKEVGDELIDLEFERQKILSDFQTLGVDVDEINKLLAEGTEEISEDEKDRISIVQRLRKQISDYQQEQNELFKGIEIGSEAYNKLIAAEDEESKATLARFDQLKLLIAQRQKELDRLLKLDKATGGYTKKLKDLTPLYERYIRLIRENDDINLVNQIDDLTDANEKFKDSIITATELGEQVDTSDLEVAKDQIEEIARLRERLLRSETEVEIGILTDRIKKVSALGDKATEEDLLKQSIAVEEKKKLEEKLAKDIEDIKKESQEEIQEFTDDFNAAQVAAAEDTNKKIEDDEKESLERRLANYSSFLAEVLRLTERKVARQNEIEASGLEKETDIRERAADQQFQRAVAGQDNILQFQERKLAEARNNQLEQERKAQKQEEALRLASIYFSALDARFAEAAANAKDETGGTGVTANNAPLFALKDTFLAEALSSVIAGAFATGVENFQGKGTETSDSNLIAFSHGESVVTARGTRDNKGLVTAMNKGMVDEYFKTMWLPKFQMDNSPSLIANFVNKDNKSDDKFIKEFREFKNMMANRPVQQVHVDSFGNIIETSYQNGLKTVIKHQTKKIL
jgi:TP901 family phage tail tape measure protein